MKLLTMIPANKLTRSIITIALIVLALMLIVRLGHWMIHLTKEKNRLEKTLELTVQELKQIKTKSGGQASENEVMQLRLKELGILYPRLLDEIKNLNINPRTTQSVASTSYITEKRFTTRLLDSVVHDTIRVKVFNYKDAWYDIHGIAHDSTQEVSVSSKDTLVQVVYKGKREKPWLWIFSPRKVMQRVTLKNPNAHITYSEFIQIQRKN